MTRGRDFGTSQIIEDSSAAADPSLADEFNSFFAHYETASIVANVKEPSFHTGETRMLSVSEHDMRRAPRCVNSRTAAGPEGIHGPKPCDEQLAPVFPSIFNLSLAHSVFPACFKRSTVIPVPKTSS